MEPSRCLRPYWAKVSITFRAWTKPDYDQDKLSQYLFSADTLSCVRERFTTDDSYSQDVAKWLFRLILESGEFGLSSCVVYTNKCRQKLSTHFRQWCFAYQNQQLGRDRALSTIHIVSEKSVQYEISFFAVKIHTLKSAEYLPNKFFRLLTAKQCDERSDRQVGYSGHSILLVLRDTIHCGKFQLGNIWTYLQKLNRRLTEEDVEPRNNPTNDQSGRPAAAFGGFGGVQASHYLRYVMNHFIVRGEIVWDNWIIEENLTENLREELFGRWDKILDTKLTLHLEVRWVIRIVTSDAG